jgi:hypothetical protein
MEVISTQLYPRHQPARLPTGETVTIVGQVVSLDEGSRKLILQPDPESIFSHHADQLTIEVTIPEPMECAELRNIKFLEVRGTTESGKEVILKEYCNFKDNFGTSCSIQT